LGEIINMSTDVISKHQFKQTEIGRIPKEWRVIKISDVADIKGGKRLPKGEQLVDYKTPFPYIRVVDFGAMGVNMKDLKYLLPETQKKIKQYTISSKDVYISIAGTIGIVGLVPSELDKANLTENAAKLCNLRTIENTFLAYILDSPIAKKQILTFVGKAQQPKLALFRIEKINIPLPPLPEQKKIAEILLTVDEAIQKVDEATKKTAKLKKGLMRELLSEGIGHKEFKDTQIGRIPKEWEVVSLGNISSDSFGGGTPSTKKSEYWNGDIAWMTSAHINGREVTTGQRYITKEGLRNSASSLVPENNLLVATRVGIGKAAVNKIDIAISQDLTGIILDQNKSMPEFIFWFIANNPSKLKSLAQGSTIKGLLRDSLLKLKLPLPPLSEQQKIAEILSTVDKKMEFLRDKKRGFERIKQGLMNDLLTGKKRVKVEAKDGLN